MGDIQTDKVIIIIITITSNYGSHTLDHDNVHAIITNWRAVKTFNVLSTRRATA